jgi:GAF domain-containing protein
LVSQQIENLRILAEAQRSRNIAEQATRRLTHEGWMNYFEQNADKAIGFTYNQDQVEPLTEQPAADTSPGFSQPLRIKEQVIGELSISELSEVEEDTRTIIETIVEQLGTHLDNLRLFEQTQSALGETSLLYRASSRLTAATNLDEMVAAVAEGLSIPQVNRVVLMGFDRDETGEMQTIRILASWYNGRGTPPLPAGTTYPRTIFSSIGLLISREPAFYNDTLNDPRVDLALKQVLSQLKIHSLASLPLWVGGLQLGSLLFESEELHHFTQNEIRSFPALVGQLAISIQNYLLLQRTQNRALFEQKTREITARVYNAPSIDSMLRTAAREIGQVLGRQTYAYLGKGLARDEEHEN